MTQKTWTRWCAVAIAATLGLGACGGEAGEEDNGAANNAAENNAAENNAAGNNGKQDAPNSDANNGSTAEAASICVGVRGNGPRIFAHFGAMARIHEHYGLISGVAGGSSGSITSFVTESMYANPEVFRCGESSCSDREAAARIALMFKSIEGYVALIAGTDEAIAFQQLLPIITAIQEEGVGTLVEEEKYEQARDALADILGSDDLRALVNPEVLELLAESPDASYHLQDLWSSISSFGSFAVDSDAILIRPGLLDWGAFAEKIGRVGSFYAGYGPADAEAWQAFFDGCAEQGRGKNWREIAALDAGGGQTCGELYDEMASAWREALLEDEGAYDSRIDDPVGRHLPALVTTSVMTGDAIDIWEQARADYLNATEYDFTIDYEDVRLGYWGQQADLALVESNPGGFEDLKTRKFIALGDSPYREALSLSPAEPGLARALEIRDGLVSTGGWSDLEPTLVLKNLGCEQVILVTREGDTVGFGAQVSRLLGMTDAQSDELFAPGEESSVKLSLEQADGVWCTGWDSVDSFDFAGAFDDAYSAPLQTTSPALTDGDDAYTEISEELGRVGCTAGVAE